MIKLPAVQPYIGNNQRLAPRPPYSAAQMKEVKYWVKILKQIRREELEANESQDKSSRSRKTQG